jgi:hypothetical protein
LEEELALFHDMRRQENKQFLHPSSDDILDISLRKHREEGRRSGRKEKERKTLAWNKETERKEGRKEGRKNSSV